MTLQRKVVSAFIVWHLAAIALAGLAPTAALRSPLRTYIAMTGLAQQWAMFSNPPRSDTYWRVRHYIQPPSGRLWTATELIGPAHREDRVRLARSFRDSFQDKALELALEGFFNRRTPSLVAPGTRPQELPDDLAPIGRYFARRFARARSMEPDERIIRTEVWVATVDNKAFGSPVDRPGLLDRRAALLEYGDGPVEDRLRVRPYPPYHGVEEEAGIRWVLEYFEES
jgi:hypothetical protein